MVLSASSEVPEKGFLVSRKPVVKPVAEGGRSGAALKAVLWTYRKTVSPRNHSETHPGKRTGGDRRRLLKRPVWGAEPAS